MPKKQPPPEQEKIIAQIQEEYFDPPTPEPVPAGLCGHVNRHARDLNNEATELFCELKAGHEGNHETDYQCLRYADGSFKQSKLEKYEVGGKVYVIATERAEWGDAASTPPEEISPDLDQLKRLRATKDAAKTNAEE